MEKTVKTSETAAFSCIKESADILRGFRSHSLSQLVQITLADHSRVAIVLVASWERPRAWELVELAGSWAALVVWDQTLQAVIP